MALAEEERRSMTPLALLRRVYRWLTRCRHGARDCTQGRLCDACMDDQRWGY